MDSLLDYFNFSCIVFHFSSIPSNLKSWKTTLLKKHWTNKEHFHMLKLLSWVYFLIYFSFNFGSKSPFFNFLNNFNMPTNPPPSWTLLLTDRMSYFPYFTSGLFFVNCMKNLLKLKLMVGNAHSERWAWKYWQRGKLYESLKLWTKLKRIQDTDFGVYHWKWCTPVLIKELVALKKFSQAWNVSSANREKIKGWDRTEIFGV